MRLIEGEDCRRESQAGLSARAAQRRSRCGRRCSSRPRHRSALSYSCTSFVTSTNFWSEKHFPLAIFGSHSVTVILVTPTKSMLADIPRCVSRRTQATRISEVVKHTATSVVTIERFIIEQEKLHPEATGELSGLLYDLALAAKMIANKVRSAGLADILGATDLENVQGETQP